MNEAAFLQEVERRARWRLALFNRVFFAVRDEATRLLGRQLEPTEAEALIQAISRGMGKL